ncbi:MAG: pyridoxamine 5'-phosphate oxidase family protein [Chloracidobacterium sp.]|nr:pyridoxamine 5'-phosphate oxidase family protein [Chloracidobacterium sp.]
MLEVEELSRPQIVELLDRIDYGHLACSLNDLPYVIPVHFVHDNGEIFVYTTEGKKSRILSVNLGYAFNSRKLSTIKIG